MTPDRELVAAKAALDRGNPHRALEHLNNSGAFELAQTWSLQAQAFLALDQPDNAYKSVTQGLRIEPTNDELELSLARVHSDRKDHVAAEKALLRVLNRNPQHVNGLFLYGWVLAETGDTDGAREIIDKMPDGAKANDPSTQALRAYVAMIDGQQTESKAHLARGLEMDPENTWLRRMAGLQAQVNNDMGSAADHYIGAAMADPSQAGELGREGRYMNHPLMAPTRFITKVGPGRLWVAWIVLLYVGRRVLPNAVIVPLIVIYLIGAVYSWVAPPLLRKWLKSRGEL